MSNIASTSVFTSGERLIASEINESRSLFNFVILSKNGKLLAVSVFAVTAMASFACGNSKDAIYLDKK